MPGAVEIATIVSAGIINVDYKRFSLIPSPPAKTIMVYQIAAKSSLNFAKSGK
jgi:hypothetical protein